MPNKAVELTAYSLRYAAAFGSSSPLALGAFFCEDSMNIYRVLLLLLRKDFTARSLERTLKALGAAIAACARAIDKAEQTGDPDYAEGAFGDSDVPQVTPL